MTNTTHAACSHPATKAARAICRKARAADPFPIGMRVRVKLDDDRGNHSLGTIVDVPCYEESGRPRYTITDNQRVVRTGPYCEFIVTLDAILPV